MLSRRAIKEFTRKFQTIEPNVIREYCQHLFLSYFYQKKKSDCVLFKGGTALRIIYNSPRFSEDLDFSGFNIKTKELENIFLDTILDIEKTGINIELKEWKVTSGGYLGIISFRFLDFQDMIRTEVSLRSKQKTKGEINLINSDYVSPFNITSLPQKQLVEEKVNALIERAKPRDFFDIYFLLRSNLSIEKNKLELSKVSRKLETIKIDFKRELRMLLPKSYHMMLKDFENILVRELKKYAY